MEPVTPKRSRRDRVIKPTKRKIRLVETPGGSFVEAWDSEDIRAESPPEELPNMGKSRRLVDNRQHADPLTDTETIEIMGIQSFNPSKSTLKERFILKGIQTGFDREARVRKSRQQNRAEPGRGGGQFIYWLRKTQQIMPTAELQRLLDRQYNIQYPPRPNFATCRRLQAVMEFRNTSPWSPVDRLVSPVDLDLDRQRREFYTGDIGLWKRLDRSCQCQGYRMLSIKCLRFKTTPQLPNLRAKPELLSASEFVRQTGRAPQDVDQMPLDIMQIDAENGSIDLLEIPVQNASGEIRIWICLRIVYILSGSRERSIPRYGGPRHQKLTTIFACPITQVMKLGESKIKAEGTQPGLGSRHTWVEKPNGKRLKVESFDSAADTPLHLAFKFCKDGMPSFETYLSGPGPSWSERLKQPQTQKIVRGWGSVKKKMSMFECIVEATSAAGRWVEFQGPSAY